MIYPSFVIREAENCKLARYWLYSSIVLGSFTAFLLYQRWYLSLPLTSQDLILGQWHEGRLETIRTNFVRLVCYFREFSTSFIFRVIIHFWNSFRREFGLSKWKIEWLNMQLQNILVVFIVGNAYLRRKWTQWSEFKSCTKLFVFPILLKGKQKLLVFLLKGNPKLFVFPILLKGKVWIQLFSLQVGVNRKEDCAINLGMAT